MEYMIGLEYKVYGNVDIKANSLEEAIKIALTSGPIPYETSFIDGSLRLDEIATNHLNPDESYTGCFCCRCGKKQEEDLSTFDICENCGESNAYRQITFYDGDN